MALYVIGDTHFSESSDKPMDVFGGAWLNSRQKLLDGFTQTLTEQDTLVLCGDFSWGMSLPQTLADFQLLDAFPGRKILLKGNHDYWWETVSKMQRFFSENHITTIEFLHNNCFFSNGIALCGTRGWFFDRNDPESAMEEKIFKRELMRLEASLQCARQQQPECEIYCFLHYPPICGGVEMPQITALLKQYGVSRCFYGHLHGESRRSAFCGEKDGVYYSLISADAIGFRPIMINNKF